MFAPYVSPLTLCRAPESEDELISVVREAIDVEAKQRRTRDVLVDASARLATVRAPSGLPTTYLGALLQVAPVGIVALDPIGSVTAMNPVATKLFGITEHQALGHFEARSGAPRSHPNAVFRFTPTGDLRGDWDKDRLAQVLSNLLGNALQHGDAKQPISVDARGLEKDVVVSIHNAGRAIPKRAQRDIFEPMVRHIQDPTKASTGLGLGLYIAKQVVTAHGGKIDLTSSAKDGTTFTVHLHRKATASSAGKRRGR